jgi:hypothetical protein
MGKAGSANESAQDREKPHSLSDVFDKLLESTSGENVSVDDLLSAFDNRSYGPLLLVPSLIALGPTGAIPGMSIVMGSVIILIAVQMLFKSSRPWLPRRIRDFEFSRQKLKNAVETARPYVDQIEKWIKPRLTELTSKPLSYVISIVSIIFALMMYPLALLPFAVALPASALTLLSIGLTLRDGYLVLAGYVIGAVSIYFLSFTSFL